MGTIWSLQLGMQGGICRVGVFEGDFSRVGEVSRSCFSYCNLCSLLWRDVLVSLCGGGYGCGESFVWDVIVRGSNPLAKGLCCCKNLVAGTVASAGSLYVFAFFRCCTWCKGGKVRGIL